MTGVRGIHMVRGDEWDALYVTGCGFVFTDQLERHGWLHEWVSADGVHCLLRRIERSVWA